MKLHSLAQTVHMYDTTRQLFIKGVLSKNSDLLFSNLPYQPCIFHLNYRIISKVPRVEGVSVQEIKRKEQTGIIYLVGTGTHFLKTLVYSS